MIYLFNDVKKLTGTVKTNHYRTLLHEREKNGLYTTSVEVPVTYNDKGTIYNYDKKIRDNDFIGYYDKEGRFQLHKIAAYDIEDNFIKIKGIHVFFDEAKAGAIIKDRRFIDREVVDGAIAAFDTIGWQVVDHDVSVKKNYNFYNVSPLEALAILQETFEFEFDYWLTFDGKKVTGKSIAVKEKLGKKRPDKRYVYGHNVLSIRAEQDYSEVYTAVIGRGKGEEITETGGYGRRIEFTDVVWGDNKPLRKPAGSRMLEDENATRLFGYKENGVVKPRIKVEVFSDIESPTELLQASYEWLMANNTPKAVFSLKVPDGDGLDLGDEVYVIYRDIDLVKTARVEKVIDDLKSGRRDVEFGDTAYFNVDRRMKSIENNLKRVGEGQGGAIYNLKKQFDERFNQMVSDYRDEFEQAKIDIFAEIEADRVRMEALLDTKLNEFDTAFNADMEAAYEEAQRKYAEIESYVNTTVDTNRNQVEEIINTAEQSAKDYAEQQAQDKANAVRTDLETVTSGHQQMLADLESNVINIDDFLGDSRSVTLDERFQNITTNFENRIRNINVNTYNMLQGTRFDEPDKLNLNIGGATLQTYGDINTIRIRDDTGYVSRFAFTEPVKLEANTNYYLTIEYRTFTVPEIDYLAIQTSSGYVRLYDADTGVNGYENLVTDGAWNKVTTRIRLDEMAQGVLHIGTRPGGEVNGDWVDIRQPYLTNTSNREWLPHANDATQSIEQITRRITELEDGYSDFITKSQYDFETDTLNQYIKSVEQIAEGNQMTLQRVENWQATTGQSVLETVDAYERKLWLNDIADIGANLVATSSNAWENGSYWSTGNGNNSLPENIRLKKEFAVSTYRDVNYTFTCDSREKTNIRVWMLVNYDTVTGESKDISIPRGQSRTIRTIGNRIVLTAYPVKGESVSVSGFEYNYATDIKIKLEQGDTATPMLNALSRIEQLADSVSIQVQELDGNYLTQSDIQVRAGYVQLGSQRLGDSELASIFRVSPESIEAITERMILNGDLYVDGDITALAVDAVEGNFARLFSSQVKAGSVHADYVEGFSARFLSLYTLNANIERLVAQHVFTDAVTTKALNAIEINAGRVRSAILEADVITGTHLAVGTSMINKLFATSGRIDQLITKNHFVTNVKAMSIEAVEGQFSSLMTRYLSANYIDVNYINGKNAWFERMYTSNAMIRKLTAQTAFIRDIQAIEVTANQLNIQTLHSKLKGVEGGLTIYGPDGRVLINNSVLRASFDVQVYDAYGGNNVEFAGLNYYTSSSFWQTFKYFYTDFKGSQLLVSWAVGLQSGHSASEYAEVRVRGFGGNNPIGSRSSRQFVKPGETTYHNQIINLGVPDYSTIQGYLEFRRSPTGVSKDNTVYARVLRVSLIN